MSDPTDPATADPPAEPASTLGQTPHEPKVRPWELELLISGALVFSMAQLPGQVDVWYQHLAPSLDGGFASAALLVWIYVKMALYAVVLGFGLHLAIRAYWVGVIGLEAVFPRGIAWEKTRSGPIMREVQRQHTPTLQALIDGADRLASLVFATGLTLSLLFAFSLAMVGVFSLLVYGTVGLFADGVVAGVLVEVVILLTFAPMLVATLIDRRSGDTLDPDGRTARAIRAVGRGAMKVTRFALFQPLMLTILTNLRGQRRVSALFVLLAAGGVLFAGRDRLFTGRALTDRYTYLPDNPGRLGVDPRFYEDKRGEDEVIYDVPSIQSDMVRDPYVRLFIPYRPRRHNELMAHGCGVPRPRAPRLAPRPSHPATEAADSAVLACMASLQPVALNGHPVAVPFRFYTQPETGVRGIAAYIPVAGLPRGENVLSVDRLPSPLAKPADRPPPPFAIPFWL